MTFKKMEIMGNLRHLGLIRAHHSNIDPMVHFAKINEFWGPIPNYRSFWGLAPVF
jgi:hypothetical protein